MAFLHEGYTEETQLRQAQTSQLPFTRLSVITALFQSDPF